MPLFNPGQCRFEFVPAEESDHANPWKESFRQLYHGVHVRPGHQGRPRAGRRMAHFDSVQAALDHVDDLSGPGNALVFLHAGTYRGEFLVIDSDVALIGESSCCQASKFYIFVNSYTVSLNDTLEQAEFLLNLIHRALGFKLLVISECSIFTTPVK